MFVGAYPGTAVRIPIAPGALTQGVVVLSVLGNGVQRKQQTDNVDFAQTEKQGASELHLMQM